MTMSTTAIKIKRIYDAPHKDDGYRILVDRIWPRGLTKDAAKVDLWLKDIAPSTELRKWFNHEPEKWKPFQEKYQHELRGKDELVQQLHQLQKTPRSVTLLYAAKDEKHNQAVVLKNYLANFLE